MLSKRILVSIPLLLSVFPSYVLAEPSNPTTNEREAASDTQAFQKLLDEVDPPALHSLLHEHSPKKFAHGMFPEDRIAVEVIHRDNPPLAASIVSLAKRQVTTNGTAATSPAPPPPASITSLIGELNPSASNPNQISNTGRVTPVAQPGDGTSTAVTSVLVSGTSSPTTQQTAAPTSAVSTNAAGTSSGAVFTITNSFGVVIVTTVGGGATTIASVPTTALATTKVTVKTTLPSRTSLAVHTSTLPDGRNSVVTAVTIVGGEVVDATPTGSAGVQASGTTGAPALQTSVATRTGSVLKELLCAVGGAICVAMLL